jgi:hypothetical protein
MVRWMNSVATTEAVSPVMNVTLCSKLKVFRDTYCWGGRKLLALYG